MRKEIADLVFPVFRKALEIKEGLHIDPEAWNLADSQRRLLALLQAAVPDSLRPDFVGEQRALDSAAGGARLGFLGIHYALACWLDETFIGDSPWRQQWNDRKLETTLFGTNERATEFWRQAERAQSRPTRDA